MPTQDVIVLARNRPPSKLGALSQSPTSKRERPGHGTIAFTLESARPPLLQRHALSCLPARGGRLHPPDDPQAHPHEADVTRRTTASIGRRTAASRGTRSSRCRAPDDSFRRGTRGPRACSPATRRMFGTTRCKLAMSKHFHVSRHSKDLRFAYRSSWLLPRPPLGEGFALPVPRVEGRPWTSPSWRW